MLVPPLARVLAGTDSFRDAGRRDLLPLRPLAAGIGGIKQASWFACPLSMPNVTWWVAVQEPASCR